MFNITELDHLICRQLGRQDLAQCARVNQTWHSIVIPFLWADLSCLEHDSKAQRDAFGRLVIEDYHQAQQYRELQEVSSLLFVSSLAKYGPLVQKLPRPSALRSILLPSSNSVQPQPVNDQDLELTEQALIPHLYAHCPNLQVPSLFLDDVDLESDIRLRTLAEFVMPRVHRLTFGSFGTGLESWKLKYLLNHCSSTLTELALLFSIVYDEDARIEQQDQEASAPWTQLKRLKLKRCVDGSSSKAFWTWLWERCGQVELLEVDNIRDVACSLVEGMQTFMPHLNKLLLQHYSLSATAITDLVSSTRHAWKELTLRHVIPLKGSTKEAVMKQCYQVESLVLFGRCGFTDKEVVQILSRNPTLHTLAIMENESSWNNRNLTLDARAFADVDPITGGIQPWACESSLKVFKAKITGIPRPDLQRNGILQEKYPEKYPGEGRDMQSRVYDRLARLTHLEELCLAPEYEPWNQFECLEMSLESGLHKLAGLKRLKELKVLSIRTRIGVKEVQWMVEQWPELRAIYGLLEEHSDKEAAEWLRQYHPEIRTE
ncbi:hypothetical protein BGX34_001223 [Mortierella sp. NVP85]|nr:hypothetical protein BGX34_001223 [Mortierella sp. NVP85]